MIRHGKSKLTARSSSRDRKLVFSLVAVCVLAIIASWFSVRQGEAWLLKREGEASAIKWATFVRDNFSNLENILEGNGILENDLRIFYIARTTGNVIRYKLFGSSGLIVAASRASDVGTTTTKPYFFNIVKKGDTFVKMVNKEDAGLNRTVVSEAYAPIMQHGRFLGAVEVYVDMTARAVALYKISNFILSGLLALLSAVGIICGTFIRFNIFARNRELQEIIESRRKVIDSEKHRLEDENRFKAIVDNSPAKIHIKDTEGRYVLINRWSENLFGVTDEEARGKTANEIFPPELASDFAGHDRSVLETGQAIEQEEEWPTEKGIRTYLTVKFPILDHGGRIKAIGSIGTDITEHKKSNQDLQTAMAEAEESKILALSAARDAVAAGQAKSEFLANMSHELRTPLNAMIGFADMIETEEFGPIGNEQYGEYIKIICRSGRHLLSVINDILDYSKIEAGKLDLDPVAFDLAQVTDSTIDLLANVAREKALALACLVRLDVPMKLIGDSGRLRQILFNLVGNAIKFTNAGGVKIEVSTESVSGNEVFLRFEICDTGVGVDAETQKILFDKFSQADISTTRKFGGTGLGLSISKKLVELMNGEIGIDSKLGQGSTFWFTVSLAKQASADKETLPKAVESLRGRRVLVVDDSSINRLVCKKYFEMLGAKVTTAVDARAALSALAEAVNEAPFEVAIIDHMMQGIDGEELGRRIRAETRYDELKMVLSSSSGLVISHRSARELGFEAALPKPLCRKAVLGCLAYLFDVVLPQADAETPENLVPASGHCSLHILVAEDNKINQLLLNTMLRGAGHEVDVANNGQEAVEAVREHAYDLVLMDVHMPELNGLEATRLIRQMPGKAAEVPVIAVTAAIEGEDREKCHQAGMSDFVSKPIDKSQLFEKIAFWTNTEISNPTDALEENNEGGNPELSEDAAAALDDLLDSIDDVASEPVGQKAKQA